MGVYILKRLIYLLPTLFLICLLSFFLSKWSDTDPVAKRLNAEVIDVENSRYIESYNRLAKSLKYDLPNFYFSISPRNYPETVNKYVFPIEKDIALNLLSRGIAYQDIDQLISSRPKKELVNLYASIDKGDDIHYSLTKKELHWLPKLRWHGVNNQFHFWFAKVISGDFGQSYINGKSALAKIREALPYTLFISLFAMAISFVLGIWLARLIVLKGPIPYVEGLIYAVYAVPVFWIATICLILFTSDQYGSWLHWFSSSGVDYALVGKSASYRFWHSLDRLILPIFCITIHSLAYIMLQMKNSLRKQSSKVYSLTAKAKGLSDKLILDRHHFRNALTPLITMVVASLPGIFGGSLLVELIFNIPGMGRLMFYSIMEADWDVVFAIVIIISIITILSYLLGDILYRKFNPKIDWA